MVDRRPRLPLPAKESADKDPEGRITSGVTPSLWTATTRPILTRPVDRDLQTEVLVVGAGLAGLTTAYMLAKAGVDVIVLEDGAVGSGETGRTTAHFTNALDDRYSTIEDKHGKAAARLAAVSHTQAIAAVARIIEEEGIRCHAERVDGYLMRHPTDKEDVLAKEHQAARRAGLDVQLVDDAPQFGGDALRFPEQLQLHPLAYLRGLVKAIESLGGHVYTDSHARFPKGKVTANDHVIKHKKLVVCTNSPVNVEKGVSVKQLAYRTYVIATELKGQVPHALWWDTGDQDAGSPFPPYHYLRIHRGADGRDILVSGGQDHPTGRLDKVDVDPYAALEEWTRARFPCGKTLHQWSGEVFEPVDHLAFIGHEPLKRTHFLASGDSGNGMTHGTLAGLILSELVRGRPSPFAKLYDPARRSHALGTVLRGQLGNLKTLAWKVSPGDVPSAADLAPGEGAVIGTIDPKAVYRDDKGELHACKAVCPHLKGIVSWNPAERSFDCPLHGSRFSAYGTAICGPANGSLEEVELDAKERGVERAASKRPGRKVAKGKAQGNGATVKATRKS